jgi:hypothetical protein
MSAQFAVDNKTQKHILFQTNTQKTQRKSKIAGTIGLPKQAPVWTLEGGDELQLHSLLKTTLVN